MAYQRDFQTSTFKAGRSLPAEVPPAWAEVVRRLFAVYPGSIGLRLGEGSKALLVGQHSNEKRDPEFTLSLRSHQALRELAIGRDPLRFADAYFRGELQIDGDLFEALRLKDSLQALRLPPLQRLKILLRGLCMGEGADKFGGRPSALASLSVKAHSKVENLKAIAFHYDVSNDFYALWLDPEMVYSCAYFEREGDSLAVAQRAKLDHICRKLRLRPGERFLDIGCGWGALLVHAVRHYGVRAHGVTLSTRQMELARERIEATGLADRITVELRDYRDLECASQATLFDKVASVGMFEHVGLKNLPNYFAKVHSLLKPGGLFLNHGITHDEEGWGSALSATFINRYVFPDGELDLLSNVQREMERQHFEILDVEGLRAHYALTLRHWVRNLEAHHDEALLHVSEATYRIWRLYMAASAIEFEAGRLGVYQILGSRRLECGGASGQPMTRRHLYESHACQE